jgi:hypothetical protein
MSVILHSQFTPSLAPRHRSRDVKSVVLREEVTRLLADRQIPSLGTGRGRRALPDLRCHAQARVLGPVYVHLLHNSGRERRAPQGGRPGGLGRRWVGRKVSGALNSHVGGALRLERSPTELGAASAGVIDSFGNRHGTLGALSYGVFGLARVASLFFRFRRGKGGARADQVVRLRRGGPALGHGPPLRRPESIRMDWIKQIGFALWVGGGPTRDAAPGFRLRYPVRS